MPVAQSAAIGGIGRVTELQQLVALLDASLAGGGWQRSSGLGHAKWERAIDGRTLVLRLSAVSRTGYSGEVRYRKRLGYKLRLDVSTAAPVRVFFVRSGFADNFIVRWIWRLRRQHRVETSSTYLDGFTVAATNVAWARALTMDASAMADVGALLNDGAAPTYAGSVYLSPQQLHYASPILPAEAITVERANTVVVQMLCVAERIDALPKPSTAEAETALEHFARQRPRVVVMVLFGGVLALLAAVAVIGLAVAFLLSR